MKNNIHIEVRRHNRKPLTNEDLRNRGHHFMWEVIVVTEDIDAVGCLPFHKEFFKKSKFAFKLKRILGALASQGMSYEEIRNWIIESDWIYKNSVDYAYPFYGDSVDGSWTYNREDIIYWKWVYNHEREQINGLMYTIVESIPANIAPHDYFLTCVWPNIIALRELGADVNYISQNGESIADAAHRIANPVLLGILGIN